MTPGNQGCTKPTQMMSASQYRQIDPTIRSFLDRIEEAGVDLYAPDLAKFVSFVPEMDSYRQLEACKTGSVNWRVVHPVGQAGKSNPFILYLCRVQQDGLDAWESHGQSALQIAQASHSGLVFAEIDRGSTSARAVADVRKILEILEFKADSFGLDPESWVMVADGDSSLVAIESLVGVTRNALSQPAGLSLLTPVLGTKADDEMSYCLTCLASGSFNSEFNPTLEQLRLLPPTLIVLAGVDPFRSTAEAFAQRLVLADVETVAVCVFGAIHDFCWLAPLLDLAVTATAHGLVTNMVTTSFATTLRP
ncbi:alpha/beta hydrolase [Thalassospira xiamenensis]|uniref:Acetyl esterase/lipase n=1 Tax=Thalassospira xiamenensis TaxID=220697 RepID=A0A285TF05_9PROT|nr:alpha/beta hydrolase fold domain-containing protein [Thalassospira xiamenensis]SOC20308.1 Acetyl esterase/lipase [Thalassospira xiamenensis]